MAGSETLETALKSTFDSQNILFLEAARYAGYARNQDDLSGVLLKKESYAGFVELHIEQGPIWKLKVPFNFRFTQVMVDVEEKSVIIGERNKVALEALQRAIDEGHKKVAYYMEAGTCWILGDV